MDHTIAKFQHPAIMSDDHHRAVLPVCQFAQHDHDAAATVRVERGGGLVRQNHLGVGRDCPTDLCINNATI